MEKKISKWVEKGLIEKKTALILLEDIKAENLRKHKIRMNITIYTIASVLIGMGVITFISANDWILKLLNNLGDFMKILLMFFATSLCFLGGYKLAYEKQSFPRLGNTLIVLSSILIGATYALSGQIYNINANSSTLMFIWLVSILPIAYIYKSFPVNVISIILFILGIIYYYMDIGIDKALTWTIFIPVLIGVGLYLIGNIPVVLNKYNSFSLSYKLTGLVPIFITLIILTCSVEKSYQLISPYYILPILFLIGLNIFNYIKSDKKDSELITVETILMGCISIFTLIILLIDIPVFLVTLLANIALISIIYYGFNYGYKFENQRIIILTNWFLIIYITINYCRWGWSSLDKSLFFILGGIILLAIGIYLEKKRKTIKGDKNES